MDGIKRSHRSRSRVWSQGEAREVLQAWAASGLTMAEYARAHGLSEKRLWYWRKRLKGLGFEPERTLDAQAAPFAPVRVVPSHPEGRCCFEVVLSSGMTVRVPGGFEAVELKRLLEVVVSCGPCHRP